MKKIIYTVALIFIVASFGFAGGKPEQAPPTPAATTTSSPPASTGDAPKLTELQQALADIGITPFRDGVRSIDFTVETLAGEKRSLSSYQGKVVFLNFWATWCPPCRAEMPSMQTLYSKMSGKEFEIVAVNVAENTDAIHSFMKSENTKFTFPILLDSKGTVAGTYSVRGIPTTYVVAKNGNMLGMVVGGKDWADPKVIETITRLANGELTV
ncbi:MAG TPA: TlpA disulfide reductase family protein, partial [Spirochaetia bacterium]|nr:TlpA disulfide reductase family protein [Spirochaetia bacterium]